KGVAGPPQERGSWPGSGAVDPTVWGALCVELGLSGPAETPGGFVRALRNARGWTQEEVVPDAGVGGWRAGDGVVERRGGGLEAGGRLLCDALGWGGPEEVVVLRKFVGGGLDSFSLDADKHQSPGSFVTGWRLAKGWTRQEDLAQAAGIGTRTVSDIEANRW